MKVKGKPVLTMGVEIKETPIFLTMWVTNKTHLQLWEADLLASMGRW